MAELGAGAALLTIGLGLRWALDLTGDGKPTPRSWGGGDGHDSRHPCAPRISLWYGILSAPAALAAGAISRGRPLDLACGVPWLVGGIAVLGSIALLTLWADYALLEDTANGRLPRDVAGAALTRVAGQPCCAPTSISPPPA